jgi:hypothetical protein
VNIRLKRKITLTPSLSGIPRMKSIAPLLSLCLAVSCTAGPGEDTQLSGFWQFQDRGVWVRINPDGTAFQCRIAPDKSVIRSHGHLVGTTLIEWEQEWDPDKISLHRGSIVLEGKFGTFTFDPATNPMDESCRENES